MLLEVASVIGPDLTNAAGLLGCEADAGQLLEVCKSRTLQDGYSEPRGDTILSTNDFCQRGASSTVDCDP